VGSLTPIEWLAGPLSFLAIAFVLKGGVIRELVYIHIGVGVCILLPTTWTLFLFKLILHTFVTLMTRKFENNLKLSQSGPFGTYLGIGLLFFYLDLFHRQYWIPCAPRCCSAVPRSQFGCTASAFGYYYVAFALSSTAYMSLMLLLVPNRTEEHAENEIEHEDKPKESKQRRQKAK